MVHYRCASQPPERRLTGTLTACQNQLSRAGGTRSTPAMPPKQQNPKWSPLGPKMLTVSENGCNPGLLGTSYNFAKYVILLRKLFVKEIVVPEKKKIEYMENNDRN